MKIKFLTVLGLAAVVGLGGCKSAANSNTASSNGTNTSMASNMSMTPTPVMQTNESAATDPNMKSKIENALKAKGFKDVTVDTSTPKMTIRGTVAKGKLGEVMATVMEANGGKPVDNQVAEK
jgi:hypothetical protein